MSKHWLLSPPLAGVASALKFVDAVSITTHGVLHRNSEISDSHGGDMKTAFWVVAPCSLVGVY
jgi:hypothetical protein